jgi:hypothetical protein
MLLKTLAVLQGCSGLLRSAATLLVPAFLLAVPAAAGPFVVNIYLAEDNFTTGFIAPGKISVSVAPVRMYSGQLVMCEFALNDTGKGCKGNIISDVVTFDDVTRTVTLTSDKSDVNPTEASGDPADKGFGSIRSDAIYILESSTGTTVYDPSFQETVDVTTGQVVSFFAEPGTVLGSDLNPSHSTHFVFNIASDAEPVPEPGSLALIMTGILMLGATSRRAHRMHRR